MHSESPVVCVFFRFIRHSSFSAADWPVGCPGLALVLVKCFVIKSSMSSMLSSDRCNSLFSLEVGAAGVGGLHLASAVIRTEVFLMLLVTITGCITAPAGITMGCAVGVRVVLLLVESAVHSTADAGVACEFASSGFRWKYKD